MLDGGLPGWHGRSIMPRFSVADAVNRASERFERRLAGELTKMRLEFGTALVDGQAALRKEFTVMYWELRKELHESQGMLRKELTLSQAELRKETMSGQAQLLKAFVNSQAALREELRAGVRPQLDRASALVVRFVDGPGGGGSCNPGAHDALKILRAAC